MILLLVMLASLDPLHQEFAWPADLPCSHFHYAVYVADSPEGPWQRFDTRVKRSKLTPTLCFAEAVTAPFHIVVPLFEGEPVECKHGRQAVARELP